MAGHAGRLARWGVLLGWSALGCTHNVVESAFATDFHCQPRHVTVEQLDDGRWLATGCGRSATYQCVAVQGTTTIDGQVAMPGQALRAVQHFEQEPSESSTEFRDSGRFVLAVGRMETPTGVHSPS